MIGEVKFFNITKGFGFIKMNGKKDIFFHKSACPKGVQLEEGDQVEFTTEETDRGVAAKDITKAFP